MKSDQWNNVILSNEQHAAWEHFKEVMGERGSYVYYNSVHDIAEAGVRAMQTEADKLMTHASVRAAYEQFLLVCALARPQEN